MESSRDFQDSVGMGVAKREAITKTPTLRSSPSKISLKASTKAAFPRLRKLDLGIGDIVGDLAVFLDKKEPLLSLRLSSTSFLDSQLYDLKVRDPVFSFNTAEALTLVIRNDPWEGSVKSAEIRWPRDSSRDCGQVKMNGGKWISISEFLKHTTIVNGRKFSLPNYSHSLKWRKMNGVYHCTTSQIKGPVATCELASDGRSPRIEIFEAMSGNEFGSPPLHSSLSAHLLDYMAVTACILVTDPQEWMLNDKLRDKLLGKVSSIWSVVDTPSASVSSFSSPTTSSPTTPYPARSSSRLDDERLTPSAVSEKAPDAWHKITGVVRSFRAKTTPPTPPSATVAATFLEIDSSPPALMHSSVSSPNTPISTEEWENIDYGDSLIRGYRTPSASSEDDQDVWHDDEPPSPVALSSAHGFAPSHGYLDPSFYDPGQGPSSEALQVSNFRFPEKPHSAPPVTTTTPLPSTLSAINTTPLSPATSPQSPDSLKTPPVSTAGGLITPRRKDLPPLPPPSPIIDTTLGLPPFQRTRSSPHLRELQLRIVEDPDSEYPYPTSSSPNNRRLRRTDSIRSSSSSNGHGRKLPLPPQTPPSSALEPGPSSYFLSHSPTISKSNELPRPGVLLSIASPTSPTSRPKKRSSAALRSLPPTPMTGVSFGRVNEPTLAPEPYSSNSSDESSHSGTGSGTHNFETAAPVRSDLEEVTVLVHLSLEEISEPVQSRLEEDVSAPAASSSRAEEEAAQLRARQEELEDVDDLLRTLTGIGPQIVGRASFDLPPPAYNVHMLDRKAEGDGGAGPSARPSSLGEDSDSTPTPTPAE